MGAVAGPPGVAIGGAVGGIAGAVGGFFVGAEAVSKAQDWAVGQLPISVQRVLGQDQPQQAAEEQQHPIASFVGALAPQAIIMGPAAGAKAALGEGASTFSRLMANPVTARLVSGTFMGGYETAQEKFRGEALDPLKIALSTGFGMIFAFPNGLGRTLGELGSRLVSRGTTAPGQGAVSSPTTAALADAKVAGPGITEEVFRGEAVQSKETEQAAHAQAVQPQPAPDIHGIARQLEPALFQKYDELAAQRETFRAQLRALQNPSEESIKALEGQKAAIQSQHDEFVAARGGYAAGPEARQLRAQARDLQAQIDAMTAQREAFAAGKGRESDAMARARQRVMEADFAMRDMAPDVADAYRRAEQPGAVPIPEPVKAPAPASAPAPTAEKSPPIEEQRASIVSDVTRQLTRAGRPAEEARAAAELTAAHYEARAARFSGALGTPEALYNAEGADIRPGKERAKQVEYAQSGAVKAKKVAQGKVRFTEGTRPVITLMKTADASTFIHETGHQWLEELSRDAQHPEATPDIRADMAMVRVWLGAKEGEAFTGRQHEKFARGFEQYMREGRAPSSRLAHVFAQFKNWLTTIYQTIAKLGLPINDDIRKVFDTLIFTPQERTVIAPEREAGPSLADIHAADAAHTEPSEAEPAMDRVAAEKARFEADQPPEVQNEFRTIIGTEAGESTGGPRQVGEGSGGSAPVAESGPRRRADGNIEPSGGQTGGKSAGVGEIPVAPSAPFASTSDFTDKAGNIRLDTLTNNADVRGAIKAAAEQNADFTAERRGVVTDGQVLDLADALGMDASQLSARKIGQAFNAEEVMAARKLLIQSATAVSDAMKRAAGGSDQEVMAYALAKDRHQMIQGQVAGITAEAGRALRAFRNIAGQEEAANIGQFLKQATGRTLFQLRTEAKLGAKLGTPQQVSKFVNDAKKRNFGNMLLEYWINALISGPTTHVTYMIGNSILAAEKMGPETTLAAGIGALRRTMGREGERVRIGEIGAQLKGLARGITPAIKAAIDALGKGTTALLPGEKPRALPFQGDLAVEPFYIQEGAKLHDLVGSTFAVMQGIKDGFLAGAKEPDAPLIAARYSGLGVIPDITVRGVNVLPAGTAARLPSRFIASIHSFFRTVNYSVEKAALAYRQAAEEGLTGTQFDQRVADLHVNPTPEMMTKAASEATDLALMGQAGKLTQRISLLLNTEIYGTPWLRFIDPFVQIGSNIIKQAVIQRTPLGLLAPTIVADLIGKNGPVAADRAAARMLAGTGLAVLYGTLKAQGYISGSGPDDPAHAAMWRLAGNQPHSVRLGDTWYQVNRLGPMGMHLSIAADMFEMAGYLSKDQYQEAGAAFQMALTQTILDEGWMRGPADLIAAIENKQGERAAYIRNQLATFVPFSVGMAQMARAVDPYSRRVRSITDAVRNKVPWLSEELLPRRDIWGEPIPNKDAAIAAGVTAIYAQHISKDPVNITLLNLGIAPAAVGPSIRNVRLTPQEYDDYARIAGRAAKMQLDKVVVNPDFQHISSFEKTNIITHIIDASRETARGMVMAKYPHILRDAFQARAAH